MDRSTTVRLENLRLRLESEGAVGNNKSSHPTAVQYAMNLLRQKKSPKAAAKATALKLSGSPNMFLGSPVDAVLIVPEELEQHVWEQLADSVVKALKSFKAGKEHYALDGTLQLYGVNPKLRSELKKRVIASLGSDPFTSDDVS